MLNDRTTHILARLELGFRTETARLKGLEEELMTSVRTGRHLADVPGSPSRRPPGWDRSWDTVEGILRRLRQQVDALDADIAHLNGERLRNAIRSWETIQAEDALLVEALRGIRSQLEILDPEARAEWSALSRKLERHLEILCACIQALRVKLELLKDHSPAEVEQLIQRVLKVLPRTSDGTDGIPEATEQDYRRAARELETERHLYLGFADVVKGLLMWVETTEERVDWNQTHERNPSWETA